GRYINTYQKCGFSEPAEQILSGNGDTGATYGNATIVTDDEADLDAIENKTTKILVTDDLEPYVPDQMDSINQFAGTVSAEPIPENAGSGNDGPSGTNEEDYETKYVFNTRTIDPVNEQMRLILYNALVWNSNIREIINKGCYLKSTQETGMNPGPGFLERMQNELNAKPEEEKGLSTIIDKLELPSSEREIEASNVGYVYFNDTGDYGALSRIAGVTGDQAHGNRTYMESFRLDQQHINNWNLEDLTY
ncbi:MAG: hypothetical protein BRC26_00755, partial [Nanohaloarchaea archaeon QH_8_44_6]